MKKSPKTEVLYENNKPIGFRMSADYYAEHECGLGGLYKLFGIDTSKKNGWKSFQSTKMYILKSQEYCEGMVTGTTDYNYWKNETPQEDDSYWSDRDFTLFTKDKELVALIELAAGTKKLIIIQRILKNNPFARGVVEMYHVNTMPDELKKQIDDEAKEYKSSLKANSKKIKKFNELKKKLKEKAELFAYEYPLASYTNPFKPTYLGINEEGGIWLNSNIYGIDSGWIDLEFIEKWIAEDDSVLTKKKDYRGRKPPKSFHDLYEYAENDKGRLFNSEKLERNHHKPKRFNGKFTMQQIKKLNKGEIDEEIQEIVEGHIKYKMQGGESNHYLISNIMNNMSDVNEWIGNCDKEDIYAFWYLMRCLAKDNGYYACNTPEIRENISYWKEFIQSEFYSELFAKNRFRRFKVDGREFVYHAQLSFDHMNYEVTVKLVDEILSRAKFTIANNYDFHELHTIIKQSVQVKNKKFWQFWK